MDFIAGRRLSGLLLLRLLARLAVGLQPGLVRLELLFVRRDSLLVARLAVGLELLLVLLDLVLVGLDLILRRVRRRGAGLRDRRAAESKQGSERNSLQFHVDLLPWNGVRL